VGENTILVELEIAGEKTGRTALLRESTFAGHRVMWFAVDFHAIRWMKDRGERSAGSVRRGTSYPRVIARRQRRTRLPRDLPDRITVDVGA